MAALNELIGKIENPELRAQIQEAANKLLKQKKFGLVFEDHLPECTLLYDIPVRKGLKVSLRTGKADETYTVLKVENDRAICLPRNGSDAVEFPVADLVTTAELGDPIYPNLQILDEVCNAPDSNLWHTLIEADNYHALQLLEYLYAGKVDCIYIDPPYNSRAKDWKYNNCYVDPSDTYTHSLWLSMMKKRLKLAKKLLNPANSALIVTIDEKEYLHLGCLLEEMFCDAKIQMVSSAINSKGIARDEFYRVNEYLYIVRIGTCIPASIQLPSEWRGNIKTSTTEKVRWGSLMRSGSGSERQDSPGCFYPIFISADKKHFCGVGDVVPPGVDRHTVTIPEGQIALFPIHDDGTEGRWQYSREKFLEIQEKGYVRISTQTSSGLTLRYISEGWQNKVESGLISVVGKAEDGSLILDDDDYTQEYIPCNQWWIPSHNATEFGSKLLKKIISQRKFPFPKSLYAVHDAIRFFVESKPDALIVDFFAGSGTTLHAVNLLNAEDGGHRRCIMVTNNEISEAERKDFEARGIKPGTPEWESRGIARYVTWPRTVCSIEGRDVNGDPLKGNYITTGEQEMPMADGFKANVVFFKLGFLDKTRVSLGMQFKELLSILWMKAGAVGRCPVVGAGVPDMLILPENSMAILNNEDHFGEFAERLAQYPDIHVVYLVTDYESSFAAMSQALEGRTTYQLYRDYLDNFRINAGRNSR